MYQDSSRDSDQVVFNKMIMESEDFHQHHDHQLPLQQEHQQIVYPAFPTSSSSARSPVVPTVINGLQWNPSTVLDGDEFNRYMNEILPNSSSCSRDYFWPKSSISSVPSLHHHVKKSQLEQVDIHHEEYSKSSCDYKSYLHHPAPINKGISIFNSTTSGSLLKNSYTKNGQLQDVAIDLNQKHWVQGGHMINLNLSTNNELYSYNSNVDSFASFSGLPPSPPNYIMSSTATCTAESTDIEYHHQRHQLYGSCFPAILLPAASQSLPSLANTRILNCRNVDDYDHEGRSSTHDDHESSLGERLILMSSSNYNNIHLQQSSDSPFHMSSSKTSSSRRRVSRVKTQKPAPSLEVMSPVAKKPRAVPRSSCPSPTLKVRKEKLGDRIAALHRLVSPFGKTDTASVLTEAMGYIQFLQDQIQTLSVAYLKSSRSSNSCRTNRGELMLSMEEQFLKDHEEQRAAPVMQDLRSRGLCLVPLSVTPYLYCS